MQCKTEDVLTFTMQEKVKTEDILTFTVQGQCKTEDVLSFTFNNNVELRMYAVYKASLSRLM